MIEFTVFGINNNCSYRLFNLFLLSFYYVEDVTLDKIFYLKECII